MQKEVRKVSLGGILSWIVGILFMFMGLGVIAQGSYLFGILIVVLSAMIIPYFDKVSSEKFNFKISGGVRFALAIIIIILTGVAGSLYATNNVNSTTSDTIVQPTEEATSLTNVGNAESAVAASPKVKSAEITIDRIQIQLANLYPTRVTVSNTGDVIVFPVFDVYAYDADGKEVCGGSPIGDEFGGIGSGEKKTGELSVIGCMFEMDGSYTLKIDLLDSEYNILDTDSKEFTVDYWNKFS